MTPTPAQAAAAIAARGESARRPGRDPVNLPMIHNWVEAIGDTNPVYTDAELAAVSVHGGLVAPPAMAQVWTMYGLHGTRPDDDPLSAMTAVLDDAGFTSVVATNCEQTYHRYLRPDERVAVTSRLADVVGPKHTALGDGYFVTTVSTWYVDDEPVAEMLFRVLKFRPTGAPINRAPAEVLRPVVSRDTAFFWEGTSVGELRIQRCGACGVLRHPPGPMCPACRATQQDYVVASGRGEVYSYVVHHHPPVLGKELPFVIALVELDEGVRMLAELVDVSGQDVAIGLPVRATFVRIDDDLTLPVWGPGWGWACAPAARRAEGAGAMLRTLRASEVEVGVELPQLRIEVTPTFVVSTAIATRDFQDVHHDRDLAVARGSKDIFLNILTDTGLVQRFVTDWAGPEALVRGISIRLGVPCYAYDRLTFSGRVTDRMDDHEFVVEVVGRNSLGDHVTGTVRIALSRGSS